MDFSKNISLETANLNIGYGNKVIYENLNLTLRSGTVTCLLGQNGVGKSTLLKTLAGLIEKSGGEISIDQQSIEAFDQRRLAKCLSIVTTDKLDMGALSVMDVLMAGRYPYQTWISSPSEADFKAIEEAIDQTKINYLIDKKISELSDGQRQKVMIARALVQNGEIILLDEPTAHLDLTNRVEIMRLLREISSGSDKAILISTHELSLALQYADQLWLMNFGEDLLSGVPEDLALSGDLDRIYHHQEFEYDLVTGKVKDAKRERDKLEIQAEPKILHWIRNACDRVQITVKKNVLIEAEMDKNLLKWKINHDSESYNGVTIDELLKQLQAIEYEPPANK